MNRIPGRIQSLPAFHELIESLGENGSLPPLGLNRAARLPVMAALQAELARPILLLTHRANRALTLADELALWSPDSPRLYFPEPTSLFYENVPWGENTRRERLLAMTALAAVNIPGAPRPPEPPILIASARAVMTRTLPRREFVKATRALKAGVQIAPAKLAELLVSNGYESAGTVVIPGQFARRGGILDLWPPADTLPTRLDFFGDEIDGLRRFDPATQRTTQKIVRLLVTPAREFLLDPQREIELGEGEEINEFHIPLLHPTPASLLDYLPDNALVLVDDWSAIHDTVNELEEQAVGLRDDLQKEDSLPDGYSPPYLTLSELEDSLSQRQMLELAHGLGTEDSQNVPPPPLTESFRTCPRFGGQLKPLIEHLNRLHAQGDEIVLVSRQAVRLKELWDESQFEAASVNDKPPRFIQGSLEEGWELAPESGAHLHLLTDGEIFGWKRPQPRQRPRIVREAPEAEYVDFQLNALVVHVDHGLGRFKGLVEREIEGLRQEYFCIEYAEGDQLYVPVHQADRISHYVGARGHRPSLSRLGGVEWRGVKARVKAAVQEVAEDLLELYAKRQVAQRHAHSPDTVWQKELEASFPYVETPDQLRVIQEVKEDMEGARPMDRLVCGDVGYGKTEVALRAAFKAVMDGKQVAMLVPTTVLAQQHFQTFRERLAAFPVEVEMLSRFRSPKEQDEILTRLGEGSLDIVIGTHRLIQPDVKFKDMGLLIIDEEQRFGVTHKEYLKKLRTEVDVLTMTATPIPRTLYMTLTGVRDISTINTPPEERLPIVTHVGAYSPRLVRQAILRELDRGGQIFFVHNRVQTISAVRNQLDRLVPEARISVAHGQMAEKDLSQRMVEFSSGEIDVLLTTTIIESGLDIPNANTLIVDRADTFGLSQLYQLRGRVGRGAQRAYAYFFRHRNRAPSEEGRMRLETLAENTQLGAGFSIAMRDLEIRGAGDILGTRQHGHIAAVGFHLYTRLLNQAVSEIRQRGGLPKESIASALITYHPLINVDLPLAASIPLDYVPDQEMRLRLYRRLAGLHNLDEIDSLVEEFNDRFGQPPELVHNLLFQLKVKLLAERAGLASIAAEGSQIAMRFPSLPEGAPPRHYPHLGDGVRTSKNTVWLSQSVEPSWEDRLLEVIHALAEPERELA